MNFETLDFCLHCLDKRKDEIGLDVIATAYREFEELKEKASRSPLAESPWRAVSEEPKKTGLYFVRLWNESQPVGERFDCAEYINHHWDTPSYITHWMPIPPLPSVKKDDSWPQQIFPDSMND